MKASEAKDIADRIILEKTEMPKIYEKIKSNASAGLYLLNIGKPGQKVLDALKEKGYKITWEDDGDPHISYTVHWD